MVRFLLLVGVLLPRLVFADCAAAELEVWPPLDQLLPANGQVVLEGYGGFQEPVARIAERSPRLVADGDEVPLRVLAVHRGEKRLTQAVLRPERSLKPGKRYTLLFTQLMKVSETDLPTRVWWKDDYAPMTWTATAEDVTPPRWRKAPSRLDAKAEMLGCGPSIHVDVAAAVEDEGSQVQVLAEVRPVGKRQSKVVRFRLTPSGEQVAIGHGMCSGGFQLQEGADYTVRLVAVDAAGNETPAPGDPVLIQGPKL
jgi:hypothetical protein